MREPIIFFVDGEPIAMPRPRARAIPKIVRGVKRWIATIYNPKDADGWKMQVVEAFQTKWPNVDQVAFDCPVRLKLTFYMPRPKSHYLKSGLRYTAPFYHLGRPDVDNLAKAVMDGLSKYAWPDDSMVANLTIVKQYTNAERGSRGGALVEISEANRE